MWMCRCFWIVILLFLFFFKQKTAYEMRISDWSSDVCSSDLHHTPESPASPGCEALLTPESTPAESPPGGARRHCSAGAPATRRSPGPHAAPSWPEHRSRRPRCVEGSASRRSRSEEHTSELQSLMRLSYAVFCLKKKKTQHQRHTPNQTQ